MLRAIATAMAVLVSLAAANGAQAAAAIYEGTWENLTFGSSDAVTITIDLDPASPSLVIDFDGPVFGQGNPDPLNLTGTSDGTNADLGTTGDSFFGDVVLTITGSVVNATVSNVPNPGIDQATVDSIAMAGLTDAVIQLNYTVFFSGGAGQAVGVIDAARVNPIPLPGAVWLFASALVGLGAFRKLRNAGSR